MGRTCKTGLDGGVSQDTSTPQKSGKRRRRRREDVCPPPTWNKPLPTITPAFHVLEEMCQSDGIQEDAVIVGE